MPRLKRFLSDVKQGIVPQTLWMYQEVGHTQEAKKELLEHVAFKNTGNVLNTVKPTRLLQRILRLATTPKASDIVLDFFAGSASTGHAVLKQNQEDGGNRRFISVQLPEPLPVPEPDLKTIADIGKQRLRNYGQMTSSKEANQFELKQGKQSEDLGFKVYKLDRSNFKAWQDYDGDDLQALQTRFDSIETPLVDHWSPDDLLIEVMLIEGFPLDSRVEPAGDFTANAVQHVTSDAFGHHLYVCLDTNLTEATVERLGGLRPEDIFVCLDSALTVEAKQRLIDICTLRVI